MRGVAKGEEDASGPVEGANVLAVLASILLAWGGYSFLEASVRTPAWEQVERALHPPVVEAGPEQDFEFTVLDCQDCGPGVVPGFTGSIVVMSIGALLAAAAVAAEAQGTAAAARAYERRHARVAGA